VARHMWKWRLMKILRKLARRIEITWDGGILKVRRKVRVRVCVCVCVVFIFIAWAGTCL